MGSPVLESTSGLFEAFDATQAGGDAVRRWIPNELQTRLDEAVDWRTVSRTGSGSSGVTSRLVKRAFGNSSTTLLVSMSSSRRWTEKPALTSPSSLADLA